MYKIIEFEELSSTNVYAKSHLDELDDFTVISANLQTSGHGQFERCWLSDNKNGGNCYISIVLKPKKLDHIPKLTQFLSLEVAKTIKMYNLEPTFKYPNDVLISGKKIAGILAESVFLGSSLKGIIAGIGVNLNLEKAELSKINQPATSIYFETMKCVNKFEFITNLLDNLYNDYDDFIKYGKGGIIDGI